MKIIETLLKIKSLVSFQVKANIAYITGPGTFIKITNNEKMEDGQYDRTMYVRGVNKKTGPVELSFPAVIQSSDVITGLLPVISLNYCAIESTRKIVNEVIINNKKLTMTDGVSALVRNKAANFDYQVTLNALSINTISTISKLSTIKSISISKCKKFVMVLFTEGQALFSIPEHEKMDLSVLNEVGGNACSVGLNNILYGLKYLNRFSEEGSIVFQKDKTSIYNDETLVETIDMATGFSGRYDIAKLYKIVQDAMTFDMKTVIESSTRIEFSNQDTRIILMKMKGIQ